MAQAAKTSLKGWNAVVDTNLNGTFLCCREVFTQWFQNNGGAIVNIIASPHISSGFPTMASSAAARAAVENLTKTLSLEWSPCAVRINCVAPGVVYSATAEANYAKDPKNIRDDDNSQDDDPMTLYGPAAQWPYLPAKRVATVEEISSAVVWLLSPGASYVSGTTVTVDGTWSNVTSTMPIANTHDDPWPIYGHPAPKPDKLKIIALREPGQPLLRAVVSLPKSTRKSKL